MMIDFIKYFLLVLFFAIVILNISYLKYITNEIEREIYKIRANIFDFMLGTCAFLAEVVSLATYGDIYAFEFTSFLFLAIWCISFLAGLDACVRLSLLKHKAEFRNLFAEIEHEKYNEDSRNDKGEEDVQDNNRDKRNCAR